jgi:hypothetical protein
VVLLSKLQGIGTREDRMSNDMQDKKNVVRRVTTYLEGRNVFCARNDLHASQPVQKVHLLGDICCGTVHSHSVEGRSATGTVGVET